MKRLASLDFDGTLFDSVADVVICFNRALTDNGFPTLTDEEYFERLGGNIDEMASLILKDRNNAENIEIIKEAYEKEYDECPKDNTRPFTGVHEVLRKLQARGVFLVVNSNRKTDSIRRYVDEYFTDIDFAAIEGHNPGYPSKPSPCAVNRMMDTLNVSKEEAVYIGDSSTDIRTAKNAGIDCIIVRWGYGNEKDYENDYISGVIDDPSEILNYF